MLHNQTVVLEELTRYRRDLHRIPELDCDLPQTIAYVKGVLEGLSCAVFEPCEGAVCAYFDLGRPRTVAIRSDMDALPVTEATGLPFAMQDRARTLSVPAALRQPPSRAPCPMSGIRAFVHAGWRPHVPAAGQGTRARTALGIGQKDRRQPLAHSPQTPFLCRQAARTLFRSSSASSSSASPPFV